MNLMLAPRCTYRLSLQPKDFPFLVCGGGILRYLSDTFSLVLWGVASTACLFSFLYNSRIDFCTEHQEKHGLRFTTRIWCIVVRLPYPTTKKHSYLADVCSIVSTQATAWTFAQLVR